MFANDTIAAIATPVGTGAVGLVRLSGGDAISIASAVFSSKGSRRLRDLPGYSGLLGRILDGTREIDEVIAFLYRAPKTYTGEDCVEFSCHGNPFILDQVLDVCIRAGARPADPGEFTKRAFLCGKINLSQAEAVSDLISAHSEGARRAALAARDGVLSTSIAEIVEKLAGLSAHLAAWSDYPEEDLEPVDPAALAADLAQCGDQMQHLLSTYDRGRLLKEGVETAIVGKPNVGKSTLMNLLSGARRSIVTEIPGTTRDIVQETVRVGDHLLRLLDTAGIRDTDDPIEREGVSLSRERIRSAQLVLAIFDRSMPLDQLDEELMFLLRDVPCIAVVNKVDLPARLDVEALRKRIRRVVFLSAQSGEGRKELEQEIAAVLGLETLDTSAAIVSNQRQRYCLLRAKDALQEAIEAVRDGFTLDAANVCIDVSLEALLTLTGERATEKVVEEVFARFCVGK